MLYTIALGLLVVAAVDALYRCAALASAVGPGDPSCVLCILGASVAWTLARLAERRPPLDAAFLVLSAGTWLLVLALVSMA